MQHNKPEQSDQHRMSRRRPFHLALVVTTVATIAFLMFVMTSLKVQDISSSYKSGEKLRLLRRLAAHTSLVSEKTAGQASENHRAGSEAVRREGTRLTEEVSANTGVSRQRHLTESVPLPNCQVNSKISISDLPETVQQWAKSENCKSLYELLTRHYDVRWRTGTLAFSSAFEAKMRRWLGNSASAAEQAKKQTVIFILSKLTSEGVIINALRQKRPKSSKWPFSEYQYADKLSSETASTCDFCKYNSSTAYDTFSRLESKHCYTAANAFKLDKWHSLVVFRNHHPLRWTLEQFKDMMQLSNKWYQKTYFLSPTFHYPSVSWDLMPSSGGSQIHPHIHVYLSPSPYGRMNSWYRVAKQYKEAYAGRDYFIDLVKIHNSLNLDVQHGKAVALASLAPIKNEEIMVLAPNMGNDFIELVFFMLRAYIDKLQAGSFSMFMALPPLAGPDSGMPAIARMVSRKSNQDVRSDITSMELFASSNIDADMFQLARTLRAFTSEQLQKSQGHQSVTS